MHARWIARMYALEKHHCRTARRLRASCMAPAVVQRRAVPHRRHCDDALAWIEEHSCFYRANCAAVDDTARLPPSPANTVRSVPCAAQAVVWIAAAKRLGIAYVAVAAGSTRAVLFERLRDTAAEVLVTNHELWGAVCGAVEDIGRSSALSHELHHELSCELSVVLTTTTTAAAAAANDSASERACDDGDTSTSERACHSGNESASSTGESRGGGAADACERAPSRTPPVMAGTHHFVCHCADALMRRARHTLQAHRPERLVAPQSDQVAVRHGNRSQAEAARCHSACAESAESGDSAGSARSAERPDGPNGWVMRLWQLVAPRPVDASHPLFILYTSGSTGKPKGIVHAHGGYQVGLVATTDAVFGAQPTDRFLVIATPGWITGQSYMIAAALLRRVPSVLLDGSPVAPPDRFAAVIARHRVTCLKAGSTFLRMLMTRSEGASLFGMHDLSSLRLGTFCAEPVNEAVHRFAMAHLTPYYINSYWATEHGGIVWSRTLSAQEPLQPDARSWPLPWVTGDVLVRVDAHTVSSEADDAAEHPASDSERAGAGWRSARDGEQGEVVICRQYPYQALTVWSSEGYGSPGWSGDLARWSKYFTEGVGYLQGDTAIRHADGAYTFHGRSDEVRPPYAAMRVRVRCKRARGGSCRPHLRSAACLQCRILTLSVLVPLQVINVGGNRISTEEIENALLRDREQPDSPVRAAYRAQPALVTLNGMCTVYTHASCTISSAHNFAVATLRLLPDHACRLALAQVMNCVVVGMPDAVLGSSPCAFVVPVPPRTSLTSAEVGRLCAGAKALVGVVPKMCVVVPSLPETFSGKYMRGLLRALVQQTSSTMSMGALKNPECIEPLERAIGAALRATSWNDASAAGALPRAHGSEIEAGQCAPSASSTPKLPSLPTVIALARQLTGQSIGPLTPLMAGGLDSLSSTHFVAALEALVSMKLSPTLIFEHATPQAVAMHLQRLVQADTQCTRETLMACASNSARVGSVAVLGWSHRWPGSHSCIAGLWTMSTAAADAVRFAPSQRWAFDGSHVSSRERSEHAHGRIARFLASIHGVELFDHARFGLSASESRATDPQQRVLLEASTSAFASASLHPTALNGTETGIVLGMSNTDWSCLQVLRMAQRAEGDQEGAESSSVYAATGGALSVAAGRISFVFGTHGPCESIDTACSSAAVASHAAAMHLRQGEATHVLAIAATLVLTSHVSVTYARAGMLSSDGRCKSFDKRANGYVRGEGIGGALLSLTSAAGASLALLCGSSVRHDGTSASLTAPNGSAQAILIREVCARAAKTATLVESHGTGTALGDPTEFRALVQVLPEAIVAGAKATVGHLEPAAGMVGIQAAISAILSRRAAPNAQLRILNPRVASSLELAGGRYVLPVMGLTSQASASAGISSFGYSGTIAHVALREAQCRHRPPPEVCASVSVCFRRHSFVWIAARQVASEASEEMSAPLPFLGTCVSDSGESMTWEQTFSRFELDYLRDHRVGSVPLLPGTCYIEMCRAMVGAIYQNRAFGLTNVQFTTIMFLDDELDTAPTVRLSFGHLQSGITIVSRRANASWDTHSSMHLHLHSTAASILDLGEAQSRCCEHVSAAQFYAECGNDYQGEFKALEGGWGSLGGAEVLSRVEYSSIETTNVHLRSCAWLDACLHAPYWWSHHRRRPFYIASVTSYLILSSDTSQNRLMWSLMIGAPQRDSDDDLQPDVLKYHDEELRCCVQIDGSRLGFFDSGWLERRRTCRHLYVVDWKAVDRAHEHEECIPRVALLFDTSGHHPKANRVTSAVCAQSSGAFQSAWALTGTASSHKHPQVNSSSSLTAAMTLCQVAVAATFSERAPTLILLSSLEEVGFADHTAADSAGLCGLGRAVRQEVPSLRVQCIQLAVDACALIPKMVSDNDELVQCGNAWLSSRLMRMASSAFEPMALSLKRRGAITALQPKVQKPFDTPMAFWEIEMKVSAVGLNFRDVLNVLGEYPGDPGPPGLDCSGIISRGHDKACTQLTAADRAFGFSFGSLMNSTRTHASLLVATPQALSCEKATSLPITWATTHVAFTDAMLRERQSVLIHTTAGGVGLVALEYARRCAAQVHASAGGCAKHLVIRGVHQHVVYTSRSARAFAISASRHLHSLRLHAILNSLSGDFTAVSFALLGQSTSFQEIGKRGVWSRVRGASASAGVSLSVLAIDSDLSDYPSWMQNQLVTLATRVASNTVHALPTLVFDAWLRYESAFRLMQSGNNIGKIVLRISHPSNTARIAPRVTQLITGGTGGLGRLIAEWLTTKGCCNVVLASRSGTGMDSPKLRDSIHGRSCNVAEQADCCRMITEESMLIGGLWHAAGVLADSLAAHQTTKMLRTVFTPKSHGARVLHSALSKAPVVPCVYFSSIAALYYSIAQANCDGSKC